MNIYTTILGNPNNGAGMSAGQRLTTPRVGGTMFLTPTQTYWRRQAVGMGGGWYATPRTGATSKVTRMTKLPTGAARMDNLEATTDLYLSVLGDWGRPTRAGRRP